MTFWNWKRQIVRRYCLQMADQDGVPQKSAKKTAENESEETRRSLEDFVTGHYNLQKEDGKMEATDDIDDERTNKFFSRAIAESRRMNAEVDKSNKKIDALRTELGADRVTAWQQEHASEVLLPHQMELINAAQHQ